MGRSGVGLIGILCVISFCSTASAGEPLPYFDARLDAAGLPRVQDRKSVV